MHDLIECYEVDKKSIECFIFGEFEHARLDNYSGKKYLFHYRKRLIAETFF